MNKDRKTYNVIAQAVCKTRKGWTASVGLTSVIEIRASSKMGAIRAAKRKWRERKELPVPGYARKARCVIHAHAEEVGGFGQSSRPCPKGKIWTDWEKRCVEYH